MHYIRLHALHAITWFTHCYMAGWASSDPPQMSPHHPVTVQPPPPWVCWVHGRVAPRRHFVWQGGLTVRGGNKRQIQSWTFSKHVLAHNGEKAGEDHLSRRTSHCWPHEAWGRGPEDNIPRHPVTWFPFTECVRPQLSRRAFAGHQYLEYEPQKCPRNPGARGFGRVNSGTWFEAAQLRANQLSAAAGGRGTKCAVAGLVWVSDASFGGKNTTWHGVYGAYKARNRSGCTSRKHVITCKTCKAM